MWKRMPAMAGWVAMAVVAEASYLGSYTARIGPDDHTSSRGVPLHRVADILQQDRANYYRFGLRDPEDTGIGYFRSRSRRARIGRMLSRGWIERGLESEIVWGNPLLRVDLYSEHIEIHKIPVSRSTPLSGRDRVPPLSSSQEAPSSLETLPDLPEVRQDVLRLLSSHGGAGAFGLNFTAPLQHRIILTQPFSEKGEKKLFILSASNARSERINRCHACAPVLSVFIYRHRRDGWERENVIFQALKFGSWGAGPSPEEAALIRVSPKDYALALRGSGTGQGWMVSTYHLYLLETQGLRKIFETTIALDNGGTLSSEKTDWKSDLRLHPGKGKFYEINLHRYGVARNAKVDYSIRYLHDGRSYRPEGPDPLDE